MNNITIPSRFPPIDSSLGLTPQQAACCAAAQGQIAKVLRLFGMQPALASKGSIVISGWVFLWAGWDLNAAAGLLGVSSSVAGIIITTVLRSGSLRPVVLAPGSRVPIARVSVPDLAVLALPTLPSTLNTRL